MSVKNKLFPQEQLGIFLEGLKDNVKIAMEFNVPFLIYGEEGESEYGGAMTQTYRQEIDGESLMKYYYSGHDVTEYLDEFIKEELRWWLLPSDEEIKKVGLFPAH